jgi:hypothetical protein
MGLDETWGFRIGGGLIGVLITVVWWYMRLWYTKMLEEWDGKKTEDGNNEEKTPALKSDLEATGSSTSRSLTRQPSVGPSTITTEARMHPSGLRISLADSRYF